MNYFKKLKTVVLITLFILGVISFFNTGSNYSSSGVVSSIIGVSAECAPECNPCDSGFHTENVPNVGVRCFRNGDGEVNMGCCLGGGGGGCTPNWGACSKSCGGGTQSDGCGHSRACNTQSCCTVSAPGAATLSFPANGSIVPNNSVNLQWSDSASWGTGCPNTNTYTVFISQNCTGTYTNYGSVPQGTLNKNVSGLSWGANYCWFVQKNNSKSTQNSSVWSFKVNKTPINLSHNFTQDNTCKISDGISGRADNPSGETENPISYSFSFQDPESDTFLGSYLVFVPVYRENNPTVNANTVEQEAINAGGIGVLINNSNGKVSTLNNNITWSSGITSGDETTQNGHATVLGADVDTKMTVSGDTATANFKIRMENTFPSGTYNVYGMVLMQNSDGTIVSSYATPLDSQVFIKLDSWRFDLANPGPVLTGPTYNTDQTFNVNWGATDSGGSGLYTIYSYIWSDKSSGAQLTDSSVGVINLGNTPYDYPQGSNAGINTGNLGLHKYKTTGIPANYSYKLVAKDNACNISGTTIGVSEPKPWIISYLGNASANLGFEVNIPDNPNFKVPFANDVGTPYLSSYAVISGNTIVPTLRISKTDTYALNYTNDAVEPPKSSNFSKWYDLVKDRVEKNKKSPIVTKSGNMSIDGSIANGIGVSVGDKVIVEQSGGDLTISNGVCDVKVIFLISGNLTLSTDFVENNDASACMFVVKGNVNLTSVAAKSPTIAVDSTTQPYYDKIEAYIITDLKLETFTNNLPGSTNKYEGLYIDGGMVVNGAPGNALSLKRDLNYQANLTDPGVVVKYNPKYLIMFGNDLADRSYSIREVL